MLHSYPRRLRGAARCCSGKTSAKRPVEALIDAQERSSRTTLRPLRREPALNLRTTKAVIPADLSRSPVRVGTPVSRFVLCAPDRLGVSDQPVEPRGSLP